MSDDHAATPPTPAGWYPDTTSPGLQRYWDGSAWTTHTAPLTAPPTTTPVANAASVGAAGLTAPAQPAAPGPSDAAAGAVAKRGSPVRWWLLGAGAVVLILVVGIALGAGTRSSAPTQAEAVLATTSPSAVPTPAPTPSMLPTASPAPAPVVDPAAFTADADSQLDDVDKDLNDMIVTLDEDGFWRLLSNYGELSFNLAQLQALTPAPNVAEEWNAQLVQLEVTFGAVGDSIATNQNATVRAAVESAAIQSATLREVASRAAG